MPISFPSSPTLNQVYTYSGRSWIWNGSQWQSVGIAAGYGSYFMSATAPTTPATGMGWFNTNTSRMYLWDGTQWFEPYDNQIGPAGADANFHPFFLS
jgi:hypothetical protein